MRALARWGRKAAESNSSPAPEHDVPTLQEAAAQARARMAALKSQSQRHDREEPAGEVREPEGGVAGDGGGAAFGGKGGSAGQGEPSVPPYVLPDGPPPPSPTSIPAHRGPGGPPAGSAPAPPPAPLPLLDPTTQASYAAFLAHQPYPQFPGYAAFHPAYAGYAGYALPPGYAPQGYSWRAAPPFVDAPPPAAGAATGAVAGPQAASGGVSGPADLQHAHLAGIASAQADRLVASPPRPGALVPPAPPAPSAPSAAPAGAGPGPAPETKTPLNRLRAARTAAATRHINALRTNIPGDEVGPEAAGGGGYDVAAAEAEPGAAACVSAAPRPAVTPPAPPAGASVPPLRPEAYGQFAPGYFSLPPPPPPLPPPPPPPLFVPRESMPGPAEPASATTKFVAGPSPSDAASPPPPPPLAQSAPLQAPRGGPFKHDQRPVTLPISRQTATADGDPSDASARKEIARAPILAAAGGGGDAPKGALSAAPPLRVAPPPSAPEAATKKKKAKTAASGEKKAGTATKKPKPRPKAAKGSEGAAAATEGEVGPAAAKKKKVAATAKKVGSAKASGEAGAASDAPATRSATGAGVQAVCAQGAAEQAGAAGDQVPAPPQPSPARAPVPVVPALPLSGGRRLAVSAGLLARPGASVLPPLPTPMPFPAPFTPDGLERPGAPAGMRTKTTAGADAAQPFPAPPPAPGQAQPWAPLPPYCAPPVAPAPPPAPGQAQPWAPLPPYCAPPVAPAPPRPCAPCAPYAAYSVPVPTAYLSSGPLPPAPTALPSPPPLVGPLADPHRPTLPLPLPLPLDGEAFSREAYLAPMRLSLSEIRGAQSTIEDDVISIAEFVSASPPVAAGRRLVRGGSASFKDGGAWGGSGAHRKQSDAASERDVSLSGCSASRRRGGGDEDGRREDDPGLPSVSLGRALAARAARAGAPGPPGWEALVYGDSSGDEEAEGHEESGRRESGRGASSSSAHVSTGGAGGIMGGLLNLSLFSKARGGKARGGKGEVRVADPTEAGGVEGQVSGVGAVGEAAWAEEQVSGVGAVGEAAWAEGQVSGVGAVGEAAWAEGGDHQGLVERWEGGGGDGEERGMEDAMEHRDAVEEARDDEVKEEEGEPSLPQGVWAPLSLDAQLPLPPAPRPLRRHLPYPCSRAPIAPAPPAAQPSPDALLRSGSRASPSNPPAAVPAGRTRSAALAALKASEILNEARGAALRQLRKSSSDARSARKGGAGGAHPSGREATPQPPSSTGREATPQSLSSTRAPLNKPRQTKASAASAAAAARIRARAKAAAEASSEGASEAREAAGNNARGVGGGGAKPRERNGGAKGAARGDVVGAVRPPPPAARPPPDARAEALGAAAAQPPPEPLAKALKASLRTILDAAPDGSDWVGVRTALETLGDADAASLRRLTAPAATAADLYAALARLGNSSRSKLALAAMQCGEHILESTPKTASGGAPLLVAVALKRSGLRGADFLRDAAQAYLLCAAGTLAPRVALGGILDGKSPSTLQPHAAAAAARAALRLVEERDKQRPLAAGGKAERSGERGARGGGAAREATGANGAEMGEAADGGAIGCGNDADAPTTASAPHPSRPASPLPTSSQKQGSPSARGLFKLRASKLPKAPGPDGAAGRGGRSEANAPACAAIRAPAPSSRVGEVQPTTGPLGREGTPHAISPHSAQAQASASSRRAAAALPHALSSATSAHAVEQDARLAGQIGALALVRGGEQAKELALLALLASRRALHECKGMGAFEGLMRELGPDGVRGLQAVAKLPIGIRIPDPDPTPRQPRVTQRPETPPLQQALWKG